MKKVLALTTALLVVFALSVPLFAAPILSNPSIPAKPTPKIKVLEILDDDEIIGYLQEEDDDIVDKVPKELLVVTSYTERTMIEEDITLPLKDRIKINLENAFTEIVTAKSLGEICPDLIPLSKTIDPSYNSSVFTVTDLFHVIFSDGIAHTFASTLEQEGVTLRITFDLGLDSDDMAPYVMYRSLGTGKWNVLAASEVKKNGDNTVTVQFPELGAIAFMVVNPENYDPSTSDAAWIPVAVLLVVFSVLLFVVVLKKDKKNDEPLPASASDNTNAN